MCKANLTGNRWMSARGCLFLYLSMHVCVGGGAGEGGLKVNEKIGGFFFHTWFFSRILVYLSFNGAAKEGEM